MWSLDVLDITRRLVWVMCAALTIQSNPVANVLWNSSVSDSQVYMHPSVLPVKYKSPRVSGAASFFTFLPPPTASFAPSTTPFLLGRTILEGGGWSCASGWPSTLIITVIWLLWCLALCFAGKWGPNENNFWFWSCPLSVLFSALLKKRNDTNSSQLTVPSEFASIFMNKWFNASAEIPAEYSGLRTARNCRTNSFAFSSPSCSLYILRNWDNSSNWKYSDHDADMLLLAVMATVKCTFGIGIGTTSSLLGFNCAAGLVWLLGFGVVACC